MQLSALSKNPGQHQTRPSKFLALSDRNHFSAKMTCKQKMATNEPPGLPAGHEISENFKF